MNPLHGEVVTAGVMSIFYSVGHDGNGRGLLVDCYGNGRTLLVVCYVDEELDS